jgi:branched-chain amino acid transport system permease protein
LRSGWPSRSSSGGLGTIEGPIIGTAVYMVLQQTLASYNAWYLIILGLVAILVALFAHRGLWGLVDERLNLRLFPVVSPARVS